MPLSDKPRVTAFLFFALSCEAKPFIAHFGLKKNLEQSVFEIYQSDTMLLTVTGTGKAAMAAGVAYSLALWGSEYQPLILNLGIAGHKTSALGQLWIAEKVSDSDSNKCHYPQYLPKTTLGSAPLVTVSQPQANYAQDTLYDMEASAFYETATRFTSSELVLIAKVVSDNEHNTFQAIKAKQVSSWMAQNMEAAVTLLGQLELRTQALHWPPCAEFLTVIQRQHFTVTEKIQLKKLLARWQVLTGDAPLPFPLAGCSTAQIFLSNLSALITQQPTIL